MTEVSISYMVKQLRVLSAAVRATKTDEEWQQLLERESVMGFKELDSSPSED